MFKFLTKKPEHSEWMSGLLFAEACIQERMPAMRVLGVLNERSRHIEFVCGAYQAVNHYRYLEWLDEQHSAD